jgi:hypothetical protein
MRIPPLGELRPRITASVRLESFALFAVGTGRSESFIDNKRDGGMPSRNSVWPEIYANPGSAVRIDWFDLLSPLCSLAIKPQLRPDGSRHLTRLPSSAGHVCEGATTSVSLLRRRSTATRMAQGRALRPRSREPLRSSHLAAGPSGIGSVLASRLRFIQEDYEWVFSVDT